MSFLSVSSKKTRVHLSPENLSSIVSEYTNSQQDDFVSDIAILPIYKSFIQIIKSSKDSWINICKIKKEDDDKGMIYKYLVEHSKTLCNSRNNQSMREKQS